MPLLDEPRRPAWLLARTTEPLLRQLPVDGTWADVVRRASQEGIVVHVTRNESMLDLLTIDHLNKRYGLPRVGFSSEVGAWTRSATREPEPAERIKNALLAGESAVLFLKRPPSVLDRAAARTTLRGRSEDSALVRALFELQRTLDKPIFMIPETFVWTQRPERLGFSIVDTLFGPSEFPGDLRSAAQFFLNFKNCIVRAGEPVVVRDVLAQEDDLADDAAVRRLTYALLRRVERERKSILGPAQKPADRLREEVLKSPKLRAIMNDLAGPGQAERALLEDKARDMLRELEAAPDPPTLRGLEIFADTLASRVYTGLDIDKAGIERVRDAARDGTVVLLPSHRSHVDYVLLSYVLRKNGLSVPVIAAGDNLSFFPVGGVFRRAGAFFIRRSFKGDRLYTAVVDAYIRKLMRDGFAIEFFLEGGRSRTGKLLPPKLGLLNMVVDAALSLEGRPISFVPVSIGYERMMEESAFARELSGSSKEQESAGALFKLGDVFREKYGRANVQFGKVIELGALRKELRLEDRLSPAKRRSLVTRLAHQVMSEINRAALVTPGSLVATALLCHGRRGMAHIELVEQCARLCALLRAMGARTAPSLTRGGTGELREIAIREAAILYVRGGLVRQHVPGDTLTGPARKRARIYTGDDVIYSVPDDRRLHLDFAKNILVHRFVDRALVSLALLASPSRRGVREPPESPAPAGGLLARTELRERVQSLSRLFKYEFMFRADAPFETIFEETLAAMITAGELAQGEGQAIGFGPGHDGLDGRGWVVLFASMVKNFVESYRIAARAARTLLKGPLGERELVTKALRIGEQMFLGGEIERSEAVSRPAIENAFTAFVEQGYIAKRDGKLALAESFMTPEGAAAVEAKVASYLGSRSGVLGGSSL